eukprot:scaffold179037_cov37-Tisochrysis_lutea.AAC.3
MGRIACMLVKIKMQSKRKQCGNRRMAMTSWDISAQKLHAIGSGVKTVGVCRADGVSESIIAIKMPSIDHSCGQRRHLMLFTGLGGGKTTQLVMKITPSANETSSRMESLSLPAIKHDNVKLVTRAH